MHERDCYVKVVHERDYYVKVVHERDCKLNFKIADVHINTDSVRSKNLYLKYQGHQFFRFYTL